MTPISSPRPTANALSVDVEDYFQVQALASVYPPSVWSDCPSRVEANVDRLLQLFEDARAKATFFTLGWIAERHPSLLRRIAAAGHEVASHGYHHVRVDAQAPDVFREDVHRTRRLLEDVSGTPVQGYRAATFSVGERTTPWAWRILEEEGHAYSSSLHPVARDNYAAPDAPRGPHRPAGAQSLVELPISTFRVLGRNYPFCGGGYFRLLPYGVTRTIISALNRIERRPAIFYIHPWEIDPGQPYARGAPLKSRFRHYLNLSRTGDRLARLLGDFRWDRVDRVFGLAPASASRVRTATP